MSTIRDLVVLGGGGHARVVIQAAQSRPTEWNVVGYVDPNKRDASRLGARFALISVKGGKPPESGPCEPLSAHGFLGKEAETVDAIAAWMLKKPYRGEID